MTATQQNIPALRFSEFGGSWSSFTLFELSSDGFSNGVFNDPKNVGYGYKLINVKDMYEGDEIEVSNLTLLDLPQKEFEKNKVAYGDVFFTRSSLVKEGIAHSNVFLNVDQDVTYDGPLIKMSPNQAVVKPMFLGYALKTNSARRQLIAGGKTTTMTTIGQKDIASVKILIGSLEEQQKIAAFLSSVDTKIEQLNQKKSLLKQYKKGMMQKLFSQEIRFKDEQGKEYPDWEKKQLSCIATKVSDSYNPVNSEEKFKCIELESLSSESGQVLKTLNASEQKSIKTKFVKGDVLFGKLRPYLKKYYRAQFNGVCTSEIWVLRPKSVPSKFLYYVVQSLPFNRMANVQSGSKMPRSDWKIVSQSVFTIPFSHQEQQKFANYLSAIDKKIELVMKQIAQAQIFKKGLLQKMFI